MNYWLVVLSEPLPIKGKARLRRVGILAEYLTENKANTVHIFTNSFEHYTKEQLVDKDETIQVQDNYFIHVYYAKGYKKNVSLARIIHYKKVTKKIKKGLEVYTEPDVILVCNNPLEPVKISCDYGVKHNVPVIVDIRDLWPEIFVEAVPSKFKLLIKPYIKICERYTSKALQKAKALIGLSNEFLDYGLKLAKRDKNNHDQVIPIGYPNFNYNHDIDTFNLYWASYGLKPNDFIIAFTGNFGRQFEFNAIIEAANMLIYQEDIKFVLCGTGENLEKVKKVAPHNIIFPGWIEKEAIISLLSFSSLGIAPYINSINYKTNTPNKFGEYLSASLPILVSIEGTMEKLLHEYECGCSYNDGTYLAMLILYYHRHKLILSLQKQNARKLYEASFNDELVNNYLSRTLNEVALSYKI